MTTFTLLRGDLFASNAEVLVNPVNCVGVAGKGLALEFRRRFPRNFDVYRGLCRDGLVRPGQLLVHKTSRLSPPYVIVNFPTKRHWRDASRLEDIDAGLVTLVEILDGLQAESIAVPALGCGLGGLRWDDVRPRIESRLALIRTPLRALLYEP